ncbi:unnamed protein product, partial [Cylindrotheca closterium]
QPSWRVGLVGALLGLSLGIHFALALFGHSMGYASLEMWGVYGICLSTFHLLEFFVTALSNPTQLSSDSYLVNHSRAYTGAHLFAAMEFTFMFTFFPGCFSLRISMLGVVMVVIGQFIRSLAMVTCGESFNHLIQMERKDSHVLVTRGIYKYLRHPSYVGFHWWSFGTQLILNNPISACLFFAASLRFFSKRIPYEERSLLHHFPDEYMW